MSNYNVYINAPQYLEQWITHTFGNPVVFIKDNPESRLMNELLCVLPDGKEPDNGVGSNITIPIPYFKGKDPAIYNYIGESGKNALIESFSTLFKKNLYNEISALANGHVKRATLIYIFMEKHGISENNWDTVAQIFHRINQKYVKLKKIKVA